MNIEAVIQRVNDAYGMGLVTRAYETDESPGDTLALFLARELGDADSLGVVRYYIDSAIRDLENVREAFANVAEVVKDRGGYTVCLPSGGSFHALTKQEIREWLSHAKQEAIWSC
jgi:hypothetical protein